MLVAAGVFCVWYARDQIPKRYDILPPGQSTTTDSQITYTVVAREVMEDYTSSDGTPYPPPSGSVYVRYTVQVDGYFYDESNPYSTVCSFDLINHSGQRWTDRGIDAYDEMFPRLCRTEAPLLTSTQQIYPMFVVPVHRLDELAGLVPTYEPGWVMPVISEYRG